ncbi:hypothetical protein Aoki45_23590 [Algoriphagus sp. oki45]|uniref:hypothetical protein n=1 Tax=Algoriphagus sp. oki45 TaxID=3067294 RepID=UPI0027E715CD|nr:hypothetical protein Aoki45_23590 [Algoriphagus sp. oki45]
MRKSNLFHYLILILLLFSCEEKKLGFPSMELSPIKKIELEKSLGAYTIDQAISRTTDGYLLFDRTSQSVILVDFLFSSKVQEFSLDGTILEGASLYGFDLLKNRLFLRSSQGFAVFSLDSDYRLIGEFKNPFPLSNQLYSYRDQNFSTEISQKGVKVVSFLWDDTEGFKKIEELFTISAKRPTIDVDLSGWLVGVNGFLVYLDEWSGEYSMMDIENKSLVKEGRLPLSGPLEENFEMDENNLNFGTFKNAYSITSKNDSAFFILREIDWEISNSTEIDLSLEKDKERIRKRLHLFNDRFEIVESFLLENYTNSIFFSDGKLYANHTGDEELYLYTIKE